jgi:hypothetical protein
MLWTLAIMLAVLWAVGFGSRRGGEFIHILMLLVLGVVTVQLFTY